MKKEIVFTAYNRPGYLAQSVASWNQATNILDWDVAYLLEPSEMQEHMVEIFNRFECGSLTGVINDHRLGVLKNPYAALTSSFAAGNDFAVLAEDDIEVSADVLEYFEWAMKHYKEDKDVLAVLAFSKLPADGAEIAPQFQNPNVVAETSKFCPLVWGTWADRWEKHIEPTWDLDYSSGNPDGSEAGWDWNLNRVAQRLRKHFVFPTLSRSDHLGKWGGTHMIPDDYESSRAPTFKPDHKREGNFQEWLAY